MTTSPFTPVNSVKNYVDAATHRVMYRVVSPSGVTVADCIDSESLARKIACMDEIYDAFLHLLDYAEGDFWDGRYDLKWSMASYEEFAADTDGAYERDYPGSPDQAEILMEFTDLREHLKTPTYRIVKPTSPGAVPFIVGG